MKIFSGLPSGKLQVTPLPNLLFSELLPAIDDLAELKVTLHIFWLLAQGKNRSQYVSANDLRGDRTLMQSLAAVEAKPDEALARALNSAVERGTLLQIVAPPSAVLRQAQDGSPGQGSDSLGAEEHFYFLNSASGRRALERMERAGKLPRSTIASEPASAAERPNIFALYEQNVGLLTPIISEELKEAEGEYPADWIEEAFREAVEHNVRNWKYIHAILGRWKTEGKEGSKKSKTWYDKEYSKYVKR